MFARIRTFLAAALTTPEPQAGAPVDGKGLTLVSLIIAALLGTWLMIYKVKDFVGLGTTSDLYTFVQLSTAWPGKGFFFDNHYGHHLTLHAYLICPVLSLLAQPFGAYGLLVALALAAALGFVAMTRLLQWLGVPAKPALAFAALASAMPLSAHVYQDKIYSFHVELLEPALALWLAYHLFRRTWIWSLVTAFALIAIKEDAPLLAMSVAAVVLGEELCRGWLAAKKPSPPVTWNRLATVVLVLAAVSIPCLLYLISAQQAPGAAANLARLKPSGQATLRSNLDLVSFVFGNLSHWIRSPAVHDWCGLTLMATFGLGLLRPHLMIFGLATTTVAWLMQDRLLWAPRFVQSLALFQLVSCLGFASAWQLAATFGARPRLGRWLILSFAVAGTGIIIWSWGAQIAAAPEAAQVYQLRPELKMSEVDRLRADRLFAEYRRDGRRSEPVTASSYLFRYAHDRNLLWPELLKGRPQPIWILWDLEDTPVMGLWTFLQRDAGADLSDYELRGRDGRFLLLKRRTGSQPVPTLDPGIPVITGEAFGMIRLRVRFPRDGTGHFEPLLSLGTKQGGDVFHVTYKPGNKIVLGMERIGATVYQSEPLSYDPAAEHEIALFSGALAAPKSATESVSAANQRNYYERLLTLAFDGREVLRQFTDPQSTRPDETALGINRAQAGSTGMAFTGVILSAERGGYPSMIGLTNSEVGAVRLKVVLPSAATEAPQPLLVMGQPGAAVLSYVRVLPYGKIKLGVEVWGVGAYESEELPVEPRKPIEISLAWPGLFPPKGDRRWGETSLALQQEARSKIVIKLNGANVLIKSIAERVWPDTVLWTGKNPIGGSLVGETFGGEILWMLREPL